MPRANVLTRPASSWAWPIPPVPIIDRLAAEGNPDACDFPRPLLHDANDDFSFSGLKTSVRYFIRDHPAWLEDPQKIRDLCASVQAAIVEVLVKKTIRAAKREGVRCVTASGGVTCNRCLRRELERACQRHGFILRLADRSLCTDNAGHDRHSRRTETAGPHAVAAARRRGQTWLGAGLSSAAQISTIPYGNTVR